MILLMLVIQMHLCYFRSMTKPSPDQVNTYCSQLLSVMGEAQLLRAAQAGMANEIEIAGNLHRTVEYDAAQFAESFDVDSWNLKHLVTASETLLADHGMTFERSAILSGFMRESRRRAAELHHRQNTLVRSLGRTWLELTPTEEGVVAIQSAKGHEWLEAGRMVTVRLHSAEVERPYLYAYTRHRKPRIASDYRVTAVSPTGTPQVRLTAAN
jgi:hypothetical protein